DLDSQEKGLSPANIISIASPGEDLKDVSEGFSVKASSHSSDIYSDAQQRLSGPEICSTLHFNFQDFKKRSQQRLFQLQSSNDRCQRMKAKRCFAAATLELSQPENEEQKERALAAATTELERFFRKEDFGDWAIQSWIHNWEVGSRSIYRGS
ncbi:hypothetical protein UlMin_007558, partial [Ulmus minor]